MARLVRDLLAGPGCKAGGLVALVFCCGVATGYWLAVVRGAPDPEAAPERRIEAALDDLAAQLSLNPSQMEQIRVILDDVIMEEAELLSQLLGNQMDARDRIAQHLTPEQNRMFGQMMRGSGSDGSQ